MGNGNKLVGVIGGLGPKATAYFISLVLDNTITNCDQDNVDMLIYLASSTPDRTAYILDNTKENPTKELSDIAIKLEKNDCDFIVMPCNTSHMFYDQITENISIPFYNIVEETVDECIKQNAKKVGLMATTGTIISKVYDKYIKNGIELFIPNEVIQNKIMSFIYDNVKQNKTVSIEDFNKVLDYFKVNGCDKVILGCTELSVIMNEDHIEDDMLVDSLTVLARKTVLESGKKLK